MPSGWATRWDGTGPAIEPRWCIVCLSGFVLDREAQPWSRARTCSPACAKRLANRGRNVLTCAHCVMVESYTHERQREEIAIENGGFRDEDWRSTIVTFRRWLRFYEWECQRVDTAA